MIIIYVIEAILLICATAFLWVQSHNILITLCMMALVSVFTSAFTFNKMVRIPRDEHSEFDTRF